MGMYDRIWLKGDIFEPNDELNKVGINLNEIEFQTKDIVNYMDDFYIEKNNHNVIRIYPLKDYSTYLWEEIFELNQINFYTVLSNDYTLEIKADPYIQSLEIECYANITKSIVTEIYGIVDIIYKDGTGIQSKLCQKPHFYQNMSHILKDYALPTSDHTKFLEK